MTELKLRPHTMAHGGQALARAPDGRAVFVEGGLPGETALVRLTEDHDRYARGVLAALPDTPSTDRTVPTCPHFGTWPARGQTPEHCCGGCQWQHVTYEAQLRFKEAVLRDSLSRIGGLVDPPIRPAAGMDRPWHYRNQIRLRSGPRGLAFVAADCRSLTAVRECHLAHSLVWSLVGALGEDLPPGEVTLRAGLGTGDQMIILDGMAEWVDEIEISVSASVALIDAAGRLTVAAGRPFLVEALGGRTFMVPATSFFQVNTVMAEVLVEVVRSALPTTLDSLIDVYSGVGTFAVLLADRAAEVYAIESEPAAVAAAVDNAGGLDNLTLVEAEAAEGLRYLDLRPEAVIVDPPRTGLDRDTVGLLAERTRDRIVYVSCEPATLARDAGQLAAAGWNLTDCWPIDMFPQTYHIESVSLFRPKGSEP